MPWVSEAYSELFQISKIKRFAKCSILEVWQGSKYAYGYTCDF